MRPLKNFKMLSFTRCALLLLSNLSGYGHAQPGSPESTLGVRDFHFGHKKTRHCISLVDAHIAFELGNFRAI